MGRRGYGSNRGTRTWRKAVHVEEARLSRVIFHCFLDMSAARSTLLLQLLLATVSNDASCAAEHWPAIAEAASQS